MNTLKALFQREKMYVLLVLCIIAGYVFLYSPQVEAKRQRFIAREQVWAGSSQDFKDRENALKKKIDESEPLKRTTQIAGFLALIAVCVGFGLDVEYIKRKLQGRAIPIPATARPRARWGARDIVRIVILYLFFAMMLRVIQWMVLSEQYIYRHSALLLALNTGFLDLVVAGGIIYAVRATHRQRLSQVGLSKKLLFHNAFFGASTYVAAIPFLVASIALSMIIARALNYAASPQPLFVILFKETSVVSLVLFAVLIIVVGPCAEELFFRGFLYGFLKRKLHPRDAIFLSALVFSALHSDPMGTIPIFCLGVFLAWIYEQTGSLVSSCVFHGLHNLIMLSMMIFVKMVSP